MKTTFAYWLGLCTLALCTSASAQQTAFTYQGRLNDGASPASGVYDFQFTLYDNAIEGSVAGETLSYEMMDVSNGLFSVTLDFGAASFDGSPRWLEIAVRTNGAAEFTPLSPRTEITPVPYALHALSVSSNGIAGTYAGSVTFGNPSNVFIGNFTGDGAALTNVDAATATTAATSGAATNVYAGGSVTTSNVTTYVPSDQLTNGSAFLGYGSLQLPAAWYGQTWVGNENPRNGIEWWDTGWDGTPYPPSDYTTPHEAFIQAAKGWGGNTDWFGGKETTLHLAASGDMRLEPGFVAYGRNNYGATKLTLGNEDGNPVTYQNYAHGSVYNHGLGPSQSYQSIKPWAKGYSLPLVIWAIGSANSAEYFSTPGIQGWAGDTNATDKTMGELSFFSKMPTPDIWQPTIAEQSAVGVEVFRMRTNDVVFKQNGIVLDVMTNWSGVAISNRSDIYMGTPGGTRKRILDNSGQVGQADSGTQFIQTYNGNANHGFGLGTVNGIATDYIMTDTQVGIIKAGQPSTMVVRFDVLNNTNTFTGGLYATNFCGPLSTPASSTAAGTAGEIRWDANYIYVCTAANTWKRVAISTW